MNATSLSPLAGGTWQPPGYLQTKVSIYRHVYGDSGYKVCTQSRRQWLACEQLSSSAGALSAITKATVASIGRCDLCCLLDAPPH